MNVLRSAGAAMVLALATQALADGGRLQLASVERGDRGARAPAAEVRAGADGSLRELAGDLARGYAAHLAELINDYRERHGLAPLELVEDLSQIAMQHTEVMATRRRISHDGFRQRYRSAGSRVCVENVGWNFPHPEAQLQGWRASPGHHRNLLEPKVRRVGVAVQDAYVTFFACS